MGTCLEDVVLAEEEVALDELLGDYLLRDQLLQADLVSLALELVGDGGELDLYFYGLV